MIERAETPVKIFELHQPTPTLLRFAWVVLFVVCIGFLITSVPGYLFRVTTILPDHGPAGDFSSGYVYFRVMNTIVSLASSILSLFLSWVLYRTKFENLAVAAISFYLLLYGVIMTGPLEFWGTYWIGSSEFAISVQTILLGTPTIALMALYPNGRFVPGWSKWLLLVSLGWNISPFFIGIDLFTNNLVVLIILIIFWLSLILLGVAAQFYRHQRVSTLEERQQARWVLYGFGTWIVCLFFSTIPYIYLTSLPADAAQPWWAPFSELVWWLSLNIIPVTLAIAITRSRLWNINLVINRTIVYGALTVLTITLYVLVVGILSNVLQVNDSTLPAFLTTGLIAVVFQPLRERLQKWVNQLIYGQRDDPIAVLSQLGRQLEDTGSPEDALFGITRTVSQALRLPYVAIELGQHGEVAASYGVPRLEVIRLPMIYQTEVSGYLLVAPRSSGEVFKPSELQLLENISQQAGAAANAARLNADLRAARQQLVTTREEERRRIRGDLHDGLGPQLASQTLILSAARRTLAHNSEEADRLLQEAIKHAQLATEDIRRVVYGLRPPALDDLGLHGAIQGIIGRFQPSDLQIHLSLPETLPLLPAAVEVACFLCFQEALANVTRHAHASQCWVSLSVKDGLRLEVRDNGQGLGERHRVGVGLFSMRQRAEELGGRFTVTSHPGSGTRVVVHFSIDVEERKV